MSKETNWTVFFKEAGVPLSIAKRYSTTFEENRISKDMLMDLNKEILSSMGITAMGDIINILKQAKKTYSQDLKRKDSVSAAPSKTAATKRPPPPTAHSTTAGQAPTVSTTSASTKKKIVAKQPKAEVPDSPQEVAYVGYIIDSNSKKAKEVMLEPSRSSQLPPAELQMVEEEGEEEGEEYFVESTMPPVEEANGNEFQESYHTLQYEASKMKRPMTMYSDDPTPQPKQPRVIILPGERQDIFTTSGLQKAAKVYESGEEQEGKLTTDRSRRLLESAGLIPSKEKVAVSSVFSRLDYKPSISTKRTPIATPLHPVTTAEPPVTRKRIIKLTKTPSSAEPRTVSSTSRKISTISPNRKIVATIPRESEEVRSTSLPSKALVKRLVSGDDGAKTVGRRLEDRIMMTSINSEQVRRRNLEPAVPSSVTRRTPVKTRKSGLFAFEEGTTHQSRGAVSSVALPSSAKIAVRSSMVADEYEYQTKRQRDIRSRLELKEREKRARRGGPLVGRLASHKVFGRLE